MVKYFHHEKDGTVSTEANTKQTGEEGDNDAKAKKGESDELKKTDGWLSKLKGEAGKSTGKLGPVFGNMDRIFSYIKNVFYIITVIYFNWIT